jgi:hypothetical protein
MVKYIILRGLCFDMDEMFIILIYFLKGYHVGKPSSDRQKKSENFETRVSK